MDVTTWFHNVHFTICRGSLVPCISGRKNQSRQGVGGAPDTCWTWILFSFLCLLLCLFLYEPRKFVDIKQPMMSACEGPCYLFDSLWRRLCLYGPTDRLHGLLFHYLHVEDVGKLLRFCAIYRNYEWRHCRSPYGSASLAVCGSV